MQPLVEHADNARGANIEALNVVFRGHTNLGMPQLLGRIVEAVGTIDRRRHRLANRLRTHPIELRDLPYLTEVCTVVRRIPPRSNLGWKDRFRLCPELPVVELPAQRIDAISGAVDELQKDVEKIVTDGSGITTYWLPTDPDEGTDPAPTEGDLWFDTSAAGGNRLSRYDGTTWVSVADERIQSVRDAQKDLEADVDRVRTSVDGKNAITQSTSTPPNQYSGAVGDIWEIMSSMGSGGRSVSRWRWNGTVWVSNLIGDTVLGNVDAAKIGTGYLSADRIEAGTISSSKIAIGLAGNLLPDPLFLDPGISVTRQNSGTRWEWKTVDGETFFESVMPDPATQADFRLSDSAGNPRYIPAAPGIKLSVELDVYGPVATYLQVRYSNGQDATPGSSVQFDLGSGRRVVRFVYDMADIQSPLGLPVATFSVSVRQTSGSNPPGTVTRVFSGRVSPISGSTVIADGAITTDKIAVGAITSDSGIFGKMDAGVLNAGTISSARISAGSITADKLLIGRLDDLAPSIANYPDEWAVENGAWVYSTSAGYDGKGIQLTGSESTFARGPYRGARPGESWYASANSARSGTTANLAIRVFFYDSNKISTGSALAASGIGDVSGTVVVPDGVAYVRFNIAPTGELGAGLINVWNMHGLRRAGSTLIEDGAITTEKISVGAITAESGIIADLSAGVIKSGTLDAARIAAGSLSADTVLVPGSAGSTVIADGAITTDKILANAITAGKIAALAIEADHISANAITADKINAGAIDGKLITGARIRTSASGARVELNSEGLKAYRSNGDVVLNTDTSDGSIDMTGILRQTAGGISIAVGGTYDDGPGIAWFDSNLYDFPPGVAYGRDPDRSGKKRTFIQGPGTNSGNSFLNLRERGDGFTLATWKGSSLTDSWLVNADLAGNLMRLGSSTNDAPYMYFRRGAAADNGRVHIQYNHPNGTGYSSISLRDSTAGMWAYNWQGTLMGSLVMDAGASILNSGTRDLRLYGASIGINPSDALFLNTDSIYMPDIPEAGSYATLVRSSGVVSWLASSRKYKIAEEPIESTIESFEDKLLSVDAKTWYPKGAAEQYADYLTATESGDEPKRDLAKINKIERRAGVIAEDMHDAGLGIFVSYAEDGTPDSVMHEGLAPALIPIIRRLRDRVNALETQLGENNAA
nr:gp58-like family protein [Brevibacterium aurantiacum]